MPELSRFFGIVIRMFGNDHLPSHFHVIYNDYEASFSIEPLRLIKGNLPPRVHGLVIEWASLHLIELKNNWISLQEEGKFTKIDPLE